jgi:hypothetical protein
MAVRHGRLSASTSAVRRGAWLTASTMSAAIANAIYDVTCRRIRSPSNSCCKPLTKGSAMPSPFIFIATNRLKEGKLADERDRADDLASFIEANEPQFLAFNEYVNEDGTEVGIVQIHPDSASMEFHMDVVAERAARAYAQTLEATTSIQVYDEPSDAVLRCSGVKPGLVFR